MPGVDARPHRLAGRDLDDGLLGQGKVYKNRIDRLQGHHGRTGSQVLAEVDLADAEAAGKRCAKVLLLDQGPLLVGQGDIARERGRIAVQGRLAYRLGLELPAAAIVVEPGNLRGGLQRPQFGDVVVGPEPQQNLPRLHAIARLEDDFLNDPGQFERQVGAVDRPQAAHRVEPGLPGIDPRLRRRHGLGRDACRRDKGGALSHHVGFQSVESAGRHADQGQHREHPFDHRFYFRSVPLRPSGRPPAA